MNQPKTNRIPAPIYAAAGAGELALQQLRKLPTVVGELRDRVVADGGKVVNDLGGKAVVTGFELRQKANDTLRNANQTVESLRQRATPTADLNRLREHADLADPDRLRELATRNATVIVAGAQAAQERALAVYGALVARGERVVGVGVLGAADTVNADIEATGATVEPATEPPATATPVAEATPAAVPSPAEVAEIAEAKPAAAKKSTRTKTTTTQPTVKRTTTPSAKLPRGTKRNRPTTE
ncbi:hypothetical protein KIF24_02470 [Micromonospora sp. Llam7]|uniref:hypothetical protein n=1 Tax=Micromonospora tarapacensis TaxID=2835305 RepID=UPI001C829F63|nr:hypothetical protein [Micromonospora tarapacensis]MBX7265029.1 hypothetical protein [Micromonospora tarapacensis]